MKALKADRLTLLEGTNMKRITTLAPLLVALAIALLIISCSPVTNTNVSQNQNGRAANTNIASNTANNNVTAEVETMAFDVDADKACAESNLDARKQAVNDTILKKINDNSTLGKEY